MSKIMVLWKRSRMLTILILIQWLMALFFIYAALSLPSIELKLGTSSLAIAFASIASSNMISLSDKEKIDQILEKLSKLEDLQKEMQKEQKERQNSSPPIVASLQALSQYYTDYISKQKGGQSNEKS